MEETSSPSLRASKPLSNNFEQNLNEASQVLEGTSFHPRTSSIFPHWGDASKITTKEKINISAEGLVYATFSSESQRPINRGERKDIYSYKSLTGIYAASRSLEAYRKAEKTLSPHKIDLKINPSIHSNAMEGCRHKTSLSRKI